MNERTDLAVSSGEGHKHNVVTKLHVEIIDAGEDNFRIPELSGLPFQRMLEQQFGHGAYAAMIIRRSGIRS